MNGNNNTDDAPNFIPDAFHSAAAAAATKSQLYLFLEFVLSK